MTYIPETALGTAGAPNAAVLSIQGISGGTPLPTGSNVGTDRSANAPSAPSGSTLTWNGSTLTLLATTAANNARRSYEMNNTTGSLVVVVTDDGSQTAGTVSMLPIDPGVAQFRQGGAWSTQIETGRVRIFGVAGTYCYSREN